MLVPSQLAEASLAPTPAHNWGFSPGTEKALPLWACPVSCFSKDKGLGICLRQLKEAKMNWWLNGDPIRAVVWSSAEKNTLTSKYSKTEMSRPLRDHAREEAWTPAPNHGLPTPFHAPQPSPPAPGVSSSLWQWLLPPGVPRLSAAASPHPPLLMVRPPAAPWYPLGVNTNKRDDPRGQGPSNIATNKTKNMLCDFGHVIYLTSLSLTCF